MLVHSISKDVETFSSQTSVEFYQTRIPSSFMFCYPWCISINTVSPGPLRACHIPRYNVSAVLVRPCQMPTPYLGSSSGIVSAMQRLNLKFQWQSATSPNGSQISPLGKPFRAGFYSLSPLAAPRVSAPSAPHTRPHSISFPVLTNTPLNSNLISYLLSH